MYQSVKVRCISFDSYIKPQLVRRFICTLVRCISFDSYIKPQLDAIILSLFLVVYLLIPTSNHNSSTEASKITTLYIF